MVGGSHLHKFQMTALPWRCGTYGAKQSKLHDILILMSHISWVLYGPNRPAKSAKWERIKVTMSISVDVNFDHI